MPRLLSLLFVTLAAAGCAAYGEVYPTYPYPAHPYPAGRASSIVPDGHLPPPGECRIWYPNRPAGQQPPPGNCFELGRRVPPGAVLVRG